MKKDKIDIFAKISGRNAWICLGTISKDKDSKWASSIFTDTKQFIEVKIQVRSSTAPKHTKQKGTK